MEDAAVGETCPAHPDVLLQPQVLDLVLHPAEPGGTRSAWDGGVVGDLGHRFGWGCPQPSTPGSSLGLGWSLWGMHVERCACPHTLLGTHPVLSRVRGQHRGTSPGVQVLEESWSQPHLHGWVPSPGAHRYIGRDLCYLLSSQSRGFLVSLGLMQRM